MKKLLSILMLAPLLCIGQTEYVQACRADLNIESESYAIELPTWTNSVVWLTGHLSGTALTDFSPAQSNSTVVCPALKFDGAGDYARVNNSSNLCNGGAADFTISGWIKKPSDTGSSQYLVSKYDALGNNRQWAVRFISPNMELSLLTSTNGDVNVANAYINTGISAGSWFHFSCTKSGVFVTWTINGTPVVGAGSAVESIYSSSTPIVIGGIFGSGAPTPSYAGSIAKLKLVCAGATVFDYVMAEGYGSNLYDISGAGNHAVVGNVSGSLWSGTQTNSPYAAEYGGRVWYNGTNHVLVANTTNGIPATNSVSTYDLVYTNTPKQFLIPNGYGIISGGTEYTRDNLLTNALFTVTTNSSKLITEVLK